MALEQQQVSIQELQRLNDAILLTMDCIRRVTPQLAQVQAQAQGWPGTTPHFGAPWPQAMTPWQTWQTTLPFTTVPPWLTHTTFDPYQAAWQQQMHLLRTLFTTPQVPTSIGVPTPPTVPFVPHTMTPPSPVLNLQRPF